MSMRQPAISGSPGLRDGNCIKKEKEVEEYEDYGFTEPGKYLPEWQG